MQARVRSAYEDLYGATGTSRPIAAEYKAFSKAWGWYKVIADLADNEILRFDAVTALPVGQAFTWLQYRKHKEHADKAQRKLDRLIAKNSKNADS